MIVRDREREREREGETQAEGEAGSMHREPDVGFDPGSPGSRPGPKAGAKPLRHPGIPTILFLSAKELERIQMSFNGKQINCDTSTRLNSPPNRTERATDATWVNLGDIILGGRNRLQRRQTV